MSPIISPAIVMTFLGLVSVAYQQLLGNGKDVVQVAFSDGFGLSLLLILSVLKLVATVSCLGSGALGGLFTPCMSSGAFAGGLFGHASSRIWPDTSMRSCAVIGSCAVLAAASQGLVSALVLVLEFTRHVDATMVPMLLAVVGAMLTIQRFETRSMYSIRVHADAQ